MESPPQRGRLPGHTHDSVAQLTATASGGPWRVRGGHEGPAARPDPHLCSASSAYTTPTIATPQAVDAAGSVDAPTRPPILAKPRRRGFARAPTALIYFLDPKTGTDSPDEKCRESYVLMWSATPMKHAWLAVAALSAGVALSLAASGQGRPGRNDASAHVSNRPSSGSLVPAPAMSAPRAAHTATALRDGRVLIAGGAPQAEVYDPRNRTFGLVPGDARMAGQFSAAAPLRRGGALITGGYGNGGGPRSSAWLYRP